MGPQRLGGAWKVKEEGPGASGLLGLEEESSPAKPARPKFKSKLSSLGSMASFSELGPGTSRPGYWFLPHQPWGALGAHASHSPAGGAEGQGGHLSGRSHAGKGVTSRRNRMCKASPSRGPGVAWMGRGHKHFMGTC